MSSIKSQITSKLVGEIEVPGDKSISHRALMFGACAMGTTTINNLLESEDVFSTLKALKKLGVKITKNKENWKILGNGLGSLLVNNQTLDLGNSGTGARLLMGLVAGSDLKVTFIGDKSLSKRPMKRIIEPLLKTGAQIDPSSNFLPLTIQGSKIPLPIEYYSKLSSAQVKSSVLLSGLTSTGTTTYFEPLLSRDHTERMLSYMGAEIKSEKTLENIWKITLKGLPNLRSCHFNVPNDPSSAAFPIVAALLIKNSNIVIKNICVNKTRIGFLNTLIQMGGKIKLFNKKENCGEKVADIEVKHSTLKGVNIPAKRVPSMIDEYPILSIAASFAEGKTIMNGIKDLRNKETDRIREVEENLNKLGIKTKSSYDNLIIEGLGKNFVEGGIEVDSKLDHRIAMSFLCLGLLSKKPIIVKQSETINSSFPNFYDSMKKIGAKLINI